MFTIPEKNIWFSYIDYTLFQDPKKQTTKDFWKGEKDRLTNGFDIDGVFIHPWLYWHTVYWTILADIVLPDGRSFKSRMTPTFRDIEWIVSQALIRTEKENKGFTFVGTRGYGKTNILSSISGWYYTMFQNVEIAVSCGNTSDNYTVTSKIETGLEGLATPFKKKRLENNWKVRVVAGWKTPEGDRKGSMSKVEIRNFSDGTNSMACNGLRPKFHVIDEIGKIPNLIECYNDSIPCWMNDFGQFGIPMLSGTGGDFEVGQDAVNMFYEPRAYNLLEFDDGWEGAKGPTGLFIPVTKARNEYKYSRSLSIYLGIINPALDKVMILDSDEEACLEKFVKPRREEKAKASNPNVLIKEMAYYPLTPTEAFYRTNTNNFPLDAIKQQIMFLEQNPIGQSVELFRNLKGELQQRSSTVQPINEFPFKPKPHQQGECCIMIYEPPTKGTAHLYVGGADPYSQDQASESTSVGALYIFKRTSDITDPYHDSIVAECVGRPELLSTFHEHCEMLLEYYNAVCMPENDVRTFIQYFEQKNKSHMLADGLDLLKSIAPTTSIKRPKGLPGNSAKVTEHGMNLTLDYTKETIEIGRDGDNNPIMRLGVAKIPSKMLLVEMRDYYKGANVDRLVAFRMALTYARALDKYDTPQEIKDTGAYLPEKYVSSPFGRISKAKKNSFFQPQQQRTARRNPFGV